MPIEKIGLYADKRATKPWIVRWYGERDETGKVRRYSKSFKLKGNAVAFQAAKTAELGSGGCRDTLDITVEALCKKYIASRKHRLRISTLNSYADTFKQLKEFFGPDTSIRRIKREDAERFIATRKIVHPDHLKKGKTVLSAWGRNQHHSRARAIFNAAVEWQYLKVNPFKGIKMAKADQTPWHFITPDEFKALLVTIPDMRTRAFYAVMYGCGLRYGEAINLTWSVKDIDFDRGVVNVSNRTATADIPPFLVKDHECRSVPMPQWLVGLLAEYQTNAEEGCPFIFLNPQRWELVHKRWSDLRQAGKADRWESRYMMNNAINVFRRHCRRAGITTDAKLTIHCLRKSYAQNLADAGTPAPTLKKLMGHSSLETTMTYYLRSTDANEQRACQALDSIMSENKTDVKLTFKPSSTTSHQNLNSDKADSHKSLSKSG